MPIDPQYQPYVIHTWRHWAALVHAHQYYPGRLYLWSLREGFTDLMDATLEEREELFAAGRHVRRALENIFAPDLFNWAALGNITAHCHVHVVPRYRPERTVEFEGLTFRDENWGRNYAPYDKSVQPPTEWLFKLKMGLAYHLL